MKVSAAPQWTIFPKYVKNEQTADVGHVKLQPMEQISHKREIDDQRMNVATSKLDMQHAVQLALKLLAKHPNMEERLVRAMQVKDAQYEYMQMDVPNNKSLLQHTAIAIIAYEQAKRISGLGDKNKDIAII